MLQTADQVPSVSGLVTLGGSRPLFPEEVRARIEAGARLIRFEICLSVLIVSVRYQSSLYITNSWQDRYFRGLWYSFVALILGPWGVPWGLLWTPYAIWVNLTGGVDETEEMLQRLDECASGVGRGGQPGS